MTSKLFFQLLAETKSVGTYKRPKRDLRALEITAYNKVYGDKATKIKKATQPRASSNLVTLKSDFRRGLAKEIIAYKEGKISHTVLISRTASKFRATYQRAYQLGLEAQGVAKITYAKAANLSAADREWISSALRQELGYWNRFMRDVKAGTLRMPLTQRLEMYVNTLESVYTSGRVQGSPDISIVSWIFGEAEHCRECVLLEQMSPFTKDSLPTTPRAGDTRCLSNCKCKLVIKRVPLHIYTTVQRRQKTKEQSLSILKSSRRKP